MSLVGLIRAVEYNERYFKYITILKRKAFFKVIVLVLCLALVIFGTIQFESIVDYQIERNRYVSCTKLKTNEGSVVTPGCDYSTYKSKEDNIIRMVRYLAKGS